jgi:hypothetical protein
MLTERERSPLAAAGTVPTPKLRHGHAAFRAQLQHFPNTLLDPQLLMKRLVRNKINGAYLGNDGSWTQQHSIATHFRDIDSLPAVVRTLERADLEIVLMDEGPSHSDVTLPLG